MGGMCKTNKQTLTEQHVEVSSRAELIQQGPPPLYSIPVMDASSNANMR
jgi:hypothetical protein